MRGTLPPRAEPAGDSGLRREENAGGTSCVVAWHQAADSSSRDIRSKSSSKKARGRRCQRRGGLGKGSLPRSAIRVETEAQVSGKTVIEQASRSGRSTGSAETKGPSTTSQMIPNDIT